MTEFTPITGLAGGILIGLAAVLLMASHGRTMGASSIFGGLLSLDLNHDFQWRAVFVAGLIGGAIATWLAAGSSVSAIDFSGGPVLTLVAGVIVGVGVTLGKGCTSGHGICGIARFSPRSIVATIVFMMVAILTVFIVRHGPGA
jgi:uncharacterized protein